MNRTGITDRRRRQLWWIVRAMLGLLLLGFIFVLLSSTRVSMNGTQATPDIFDDIVQGQTVMKRYAGRIVWVTRLDQQLRDQSIALEAYLVTSSEGCDIDQEFCVLRSEAQRSGVNIRFTMDEPLQLPSRASWFGGFVDPTSGAVFDRLGRAYKISSNSVSNMIVVPFEDH